MCICHWLSFCLDIIIITIFLNFLIPLVVKIPRVKNKLITEAGVVTHRQSWESCCATRWSWSAEQWLKCAEKESWAPNCLLWPMQSFAPAGKRMRLTIRSEGWEFLTWWVETGHLSVPRGRIWLIIIIIFLLFYYFYLFFNYYYYIIIIRPRRSRWRRIGL